MANTNGPYYFISISLSLIEKQDNEYKVLLITSKFKTQILHLKLALQTLETIYNISNDEDLKRSICKVSENVMQQLQSLSGRDIDGDLLQALEKAYDNWSEQIVYVVTNGETGRINNIFIKTCFKRTHDFVLKSLRELSCCKVDQNAPSINEKLLLLQALFACIEDTRVGIMSEYQDLSASFVNLVYQAAYLLNSCLVVEKDEHMELEIMHNLSNLLGKNKFKKLYREILGSSELQGFSKELVESKIYLLDSMMKLLNYTSNFSNTDLNDVCEKLHDKLKFLRTFLAELPQEVITENFISFAPFIENMTSAALQILYLCWDKEMKEEMFDEVCGALSDVIDQIGDIQAEVGEIKVYNAPKTEVNEIKLYNYPKTDPLGFLDLFLRHVEELLKCQPELIKFLKNETETLKDEFNSLRCILKQIKKCEGFEDIRTNIIHLAYQAEHVIDSYLVKCYSKRRSKFTLSKIVEKIKLIQSEVKRINGEKMYVIQAYMFDKAPNNVPLKAFSIATGQIVGFEDEAEKIMAFLFGDMKKRDVVSIVGLPGLGKTTLARKIFEDPLVIEHFDIRAWCTVSQTYHKREVLLNILGDIIERIEEIKNLKDEDLVENIYKSLKGHRYLIVIDDLWHIEDWNDLTRPFPDDNKQSRIIVTSRLRNVASQTSKVHLLREFSDNESWQLFESKLFQNKLFDEVSFSKDFQKAGKRIVESCKGLPLAIVVIASLLSKEEKNLDKWKEISANLRSRILRESESHCFAIFELSYNNLPDQLKSCLLSFGAFTEDKVIPLSKLKRLWIAEGFVRETNAKNLEDLAEEQCMDLISRSLVTPIKQRSYGGVKSCCVHDLVHEFCLKKAKEESFLQVVISMDDDLKFSSIYDHHRLRINSNLGQFFKATPFGWSSVRSLFNGTRDDNRDDYSEIMSLLCKKFKLLRVLDLGDEYSRWYFSGIETLVHLRYLHITASLRSIPSSISNLRNLQFFILKCSNWEARVRVPDSIWDMVHLRNVNITYRASFEVHPSRLSNSILLDNLDTLATPYLCYGEDAENLLRRLPKLRKLSCIFYIKDDITKFLRYPALDFLDQLMSLKVSFGSLLQKKNIELNFPSNLKKVSLWDFPGDWDDISTMGRMLPKLEVLKFSTAFKINYYVWDVEYGDFPMLKYLRFSGDNLEKWNLSEDSFPSLEKLVINCYYRLRLKEIPPHFGELTTLEMISVTGHCEQSLYDSVREVQKTQEEYGNSALRVYISPPEKTD